MSLIDEALKRAQEAENRETGGARRRPWTPAPLPDRGRARRRRLLVSLGVAAAALALAAAGLAFLRRPASGHESRPENPSVKPTPAPSTPLPLEEVQVAPPPRGVAIAKRASGDRERPVQPTPAPVDRKEPPAAPAPARADRPAGLVSGRTYPGSVALPGGGRLELEGIVYSESNATAVINGRIVVAGESVEGFSVVRVEESRVELSGNGVTIFLALR